MDELIYFYSNRELTDSEIESMADEYIENKWSYMNNDIWFDEINHDRKVYIDGIKDTLKKLKEC